MSDNPSMAMMNRARGAGSTSGREARSGAASAPGARSAAHHRELKHLLGLHEDYRGAKRPGTVVVVHAPQAQTASRLVQEWRRELLRRGEQVFEAACSGGGGKTYRALRELVASYYAYLEDLGLVSEEMHRLFLDLSACLGMNVGPVARRTVQVSQPGQIYLYELLGRFLVEASAVRPAVLIVRDLHLADSASLAAIVYLAQNFALDPIDAYIPEGVSREGFRGILALTLEVGPGEGAVEGAEVLRNLGRGLRDRAHAEFVDLRGVDEETVRQFLQREDVVARLLASTGGYPENLEALLGMLPADSDGLLLHRLKSCTREGRLLLETLSVIGRSIGPDVLVQLSSLSADAAAAALTGLLDGGILVRRVGRGELQVCFAQDHAVEIVYERIDPVMRADLHGRVATFLRARQSYDQGVEVEEIAHHFLRSDDRASAVEYALAAAEKLHMTFAFQRARDLLEAALGIVEAEERGGVYERLIDICSALNEHRRALFYCGQLKRLRGDELARVYRRIGKILLDMGKYDLAVRALAKALHRADALDDRLEQARVLSHTAEALYGRGEYDPAVAVCQKGLALCGQIVEGGPEVLRQQMNLTNTLGKVCLFREDYGRAADHFTLNRERADAAGWGDEEVRALFNLGTIAVQKRNYGRAEQIFLECLSFGHETANPISRAFCLLNLAVIYQKTLRYEEALDCYLHGLATFKKSGDDMRFATTAMNLAILYETLADLPKAKALIDASLELSKAREMRYIYARNCFVRGTIAIEERQPGEALEFFMRAREGFEGTGRMLRSRLALGVATAHHLLGQGDERERWLAQVEVSADSAEGQELGGDLDLLRTTVLLDEGRAREAEGVARQALATFEACGVPEKRWRASFELARLCRALGRIEEAKLHLGHALRTVSELSENVPAALRERYMQAEARQRLFRLQRALEGGGPFEERERAAAAEAPPAEDAAVASASPRRAAAVVIGRALAPELQVWRERYRGVIGEDGRLHHIFRMIDKVARSDSTVLITGESGTGKELIAEAIHNQSHRASGPLVKVNCAAFVETLLLSELFGHEKGAFTGALTRKKGRFELADGGTIFLDEIGDISMNTQVALLRVLQERCFDRVGGSAPTEVDVRVIAATNRNLEEMVREGTFRLDLYYRLKGVALDLPPLRKRRGDVALLVRHFTERFSEGSERERRFSHDALRLLARYNWPGNIRELENFVRSMLLFVESDVIDVEDIREFDEFFAEGEMAEEAPSVAFAPGWWGEEIEEPPAAGPPLAQGDRATSGVQILTTPSGSLARVVEAPAAPAGARGGGESALESGDEDEDEGEEDAEGEEEDEEGLVLPRPSRPAPEGVALEDAIVEHVVFDGLGLQEYKKQLEVQCIRRALIETDGNITHAAKLLKMKRPRLSQIINATPELGELKDKLN